MDDIEKLQTIEVPECNEDCVKELKGFRGNRIYHHYHRDGTLSEKPRRKIRRHHRKRNRIFTVVHSESGSEFIPKCLSINLSSDNTCTFSELFHIGDRIGLVPYQSVLAEALEEYHNTNAGIK